VRARQEPPGRDIGVDGAFADGVDGGAIERAQRVDEAEQEPMWLAATVEQMPGGMVIASARSGRVIVVNEQARMLLGIEDGAPLHGIRGEAFKPDGTRYELEEFPLARALRGETVRAERLQIAGEDGQRSFLSVSAAPVRDRAERIIAAVSLFEDVTAREQRDQAERDFVMNAAHELQSPLAAITRAVEVLQAGVKEGADRDRFLGHIERESKRLDRLTRALLTLARAQVDVEEPRLEVIDVCPLLEAIEERMEPAPGVKMSVACPEDLALVSNMALLEQAISNIVRNSVKYTSEGSIQLIGARRGDDVVIEIRDTGEGIPDEALPHVRERFYRADDTREGFGLGLAIVDASMKALDGELTIASRRGYGTTVTVKLPIGATWMEH
jgi:PAS domain S-box-containing protein